MERYFAFVSYTLYDRFYGTQTPPVLFLHGDDLEEIQESLLKIEPEDRFRIYFSIFDTKARQNLLWNHWVKREENGGTSVEDLKAELRRIHFKVVE